MFSASGLYGNPEDDIGENLEDNLPPLVDPEDDDDENLEDDPPPPPEDRNQGGEWEQGSFAWLGLASKASGLKKTGNRNSIQ